MTPLRLDHVNIRTKRVAESIRFYGDALGLKMQPLPGQADLTKGAYALDAGGVAVVHLIGAEREAEGAAPVRGAAQFGMIDHFALRCEDPELFTNRLTRLGYDVTRQEVKLINMLLLFVRDPNGVLVELAFPLAPPAAFGP